MQSFVSRARASAAVAAALALALALSAGVALGDPQAAHADPVFPSWAEVQAAAASTGAKQAEIDKLTALLTTLETTSAQLGDAAAAKNEAYLDARARLEDAAARAARLRGERDDAEGAASSSRAQAAGLIAQMARSGGGDVSSALFGANSGDADSMLHRLALASRVSSTASEVLQRAEYDRNTADALAAEAVAAEKERRSREDAAAAALASAESAATAAQQQLDATRAQSDTAYAQLASLTQQSAAQAREYLQGVAFDAEAARQSSTTGGRATAGSGSSSGGSGAASASAGTGAAASGTASGSGSASSGSGSSSGASAPTGSAASSGSASGSATTSGSGGAAASGGSSAASGSTGSSTSSGSTGASGSSGSTAASGSSGSTASSGPGAPNAAAVARAIAFATAQLGDPYAIAGAGPDAWDCSGLTMAAYAAAGVSIGGHGATLQYEYLRARGRLVPISQLQAGDLVFYNGSGSTTATKDHVAIYLGGGMLIEAPYAGVPVRIHAMYTAGRVPYAGRPTG